MVNLAKGFIDPLGGLLGHELPVVHPHHFIFGIPEHFAQRFIEKRKVSFQVDLIIYVGHAMKNRSILLLACP